jgi:hypothetical protein
VTDRCNCGRGASDQAPLPPKHYRGPDELLHDRSGEECGCDGHRPGDPASNRLGDVGSEHVRREIFEPTATSVAVVVSNGVGRLPRWAASVTTGTLDEDGYTWYPDDLGSGEYWVSGDFGSRDTPVGVQRATARIAAMYSPTPFTAQADAEGNPIGRPPAPSQQDETDPSPPGGMNYERTTGDPVADAWLEPYKTNRVLV